jgi:type I restriction enzyme M protein
MESFLDKAISDDHLRIDQSGRFEKVIYAAVNRSERWSDPEEKVRAEFYAELIYRYGYSPDRIGVEITVPDRSPNDHADLIVFRDDERKRPFAVIECKKESISDAEFSQAVEQAWGNGNAYKFRAAYIGVVAGSTRRFLDCAEKFGALERDKNVIADLPVSYGKPPAYKYRKGISHEWLDIKPVSKGMLIAAIKKCHQTLWGGGRLSPPAAFGEFCKIIFVKVRDEKAGRKKGEPYEFQIKTDEPAHVLAARIKAMYAKEMEREPDVFKEPIKVDDGTLKMCVSHLEGINFNKTDLDTKGVAFEQFLDGFFKGDFGQYFTPREIIQFAVEVFKPSADDYVLDPACGSGGFLLYAMDYVRHYAEHTYDDDVKMAYAHWHDFAKDRLFGIEINDEISRVAKMNMILHDDGHTNIIGFDALDKFDKLKDQKKRFSPDSFDLILTNPPFGAMVKETEKGKAYMRDGLGKLDSDISGKAAL